MKNKEYTSSVARDKFKQIVTENYTKNFELLCQSLKFNKIQSKILDNFIHKGQIKDQYVGRVAGTSKNSRIYAGTKKFEGSIENRKEALMQALKVNAKQKGILDSYLNTGKVIGKYTGSIAGSSKQTNKYAGFKGFKEHFEIKEVKLNEANKEIEVPWDMDDPSEYADSFSDEFNVYLADWDKRGGSVSLQGDEKNLLKLLMSPDHFEMDKKEAQGYVKKGKKI